MIVSASYKTDIPAFYGQWFANRLLAGFCRVTNPHSGLPIAVDLSSPACEGFVFWTKNLRPFRDRLKEVALEGLPFYVQYAINGYPKELEMLVVPAEQAIADAVWVRHEFGDHRVVWRYDPILFTSLTPSEFHVQNFERLAGQLASAVDEVVVSFAQIYAKTAAKLDAAASATGLSWRDPPDEEKRDLAAKLVAIARRAGLPLNVCAQRAYVVPGAGEAHCVDAKRFTLITGRPFRQRPKGNRPDCGCYESRDIGEYDTCPHGCVYCYAVQQGATRHRQHDPTAEYLCPPPTPAQAPPRAPKAGSKQLSLPLFPGGKR